MRRVALILLVAAVAVFCALNLHLVRVWPFRMQVPLFIVVVVVFAAGCAAGWVGRSLTARRAARAAGSAAASPD